MTIPLHIRELSPENVSYSDALEFAYVFNVAFRNDPSIWTAQPDQYRFRGNLWQSLEAIHDPRDRLNGLVNKAQAFRDYTKQNAWEFYLLLTRPNVRTFIGYDTTDGAPVAISSWASPSQRMTEPTLWQRILRWINVLRARTHQYIFYLRHGYNPGLSGHGILEEASRQFGLVDSVKRDEEIVKTIKKAGKELDISPYSRKYSNELVIFCVTRQGAGFGTRFFEHLLNLLEPTFEHAEIDGKKFPPKAVIMASDAGQKLYSKYGFIKHDHFSRKVNDGTVSLSLMVKNY